MSNDGTAREVAILGRDDEPQESGAVVAVNYGDYREQEIWVRSGANIGCWYLLGGEFGRRINDGIPRPPQRPHWEHVLARGPVTLLVPGAEDAYRAGWRTGRKDLWDRTEPLIYDEPKAVPPQSMVSDHDLHRRCAHPGYEYATTQGPRKSWDFSDEPPEGEGWERNLDAGRPGEGWERFDYYEESYWRRPRPVPEQPAIEHDSQCAWHELHYGMMPDPFGPEPESLGYQLFHAEQCLTLPPGAVCWATHEPYRYWWPTEEGIYRIRPVQWLTGGRDGDEPDVQQSMEIQSRAGDNWVDYHGPSLGSEPNDPDSDDHTPENDE
jgi:hypothetical protein